MKFKQIDGDKLKEIRESKGMSQAKLADLAHVSAQTISNIECNRCGAAGQRPDTVALIADALEVDETDLLAVSMIVDSLEENRNMEGLGDKKMNIRQEENAVDLVDFVQLSDAENDPKKFVDDHFEKNHEYIDELVEAFNVKNEVYARFIDDLKQKSEDSLTGICNSVLTQIRCMALVKDPDGEFFQKNSFEVIYDIGSALHRQIDRCYVTPHFDREKLVTIIIKNANEVYDVLSRDVDRDRLNTLIRQVQDNRFESAHNTRVQDLLNLYFFVCEKWEELHVQPCMYWLLNNIVCVMEDDEVDPDDLITRECIARIVFRATLLWKKVR